MATNTVPFELGHCPICHDQLHRNGAVCKVIYKFCSTCKYFFCFDCTVMNCKAFFSTEEWKKEVYLELRCPFCYTDSETILSSKRTSVVVFDDSEAEEQIDQNTNQEVAIEGHETQEGHMVINLGKTCAECHRNLLWDGFPEVCFVLPCCGQTFCYKCIQEPVSKLEYGVQWYTDIKVFFKCPSCHATTKHKISPEYMGFRTRNNVLGCINGDSNVLEQALGRHHEMVAVLPEESIVEYMKRVDELL